MAALKGMMKEAGEAGRDKQERLNADLGMTEMENAQGKRDVFRGDIAERAKRKGYNPTRKSFVVPELNHIDWEK